MADRAAIVTGGSSGIGLAIARMLGEEGHGLTVARQHLRSLEQYPFDSVLLPYNVPMMRNPAYREDFEAPLLHLPRHRLAADQQKLRAFYLTQGYADFRVVSGVAELTPDKKDFIITYVVEEGKRLRHPLQAKVAGRWDKTVAAVPPC